MACIDPTVDGGGVLMACIDLTVDGGGVLTDHRSGGCGQRTYM